MPRVQPRDLCRGLVKPVLNHLSFFLRFLAWSCIDVKSFPSLLPQRQVRCLDFPFIQCSVQTMHHKSRYRLRDLHFQAANTGRSRRVCFAFRCKKRLLLPLYAGAIVETPLGRINQHCHLPPIRRSSQPGIRIEVLFFVDHHIFAFTTLPYL